VGLSKAAQAHREEIVLATTANFDNLTQAFWRGMSNLLVKQSRTFSPAKPCYLS